VDVSDTLVIGVSLLLSLEDDDEVSVAGNVRLYTCCPCKIGATNVTGRADDVVLTLVVVICTVLGGSWLELDVEMVTALGVVTICAAGVVGLDLGTVTTGVVDDVPVIGAVTMVAEAMVLEVEVLGGITLTVAWMFEELVLRIACLAKSSWARNSAISRSLLMSSIVFVLGCTSDCTGGAGTTFAGGADS
jgi:hypothetical protein